jgi:hypothetical protein
MTASTRAPSSQFLLGLIVLEPYVVVWETLRTQSPVTEVLCVVRVRRRRPGREIEMSLCSRCVRPQEPPGGSSKIDVYPARCCFTLRCRARPPGPREPSGKGGPAGSVRRSMTNDGAALRGPCGPAAGCWVTTAGHACNARARPHSVEADRSERIAQAVLRSSVVITRLD